jgi:hypothetical protein
MTNNTYTKTRYSLKNGTKTVFNEISKSEKVLTEAFYNNVISAIPFMRFKTIYQFNFEGRLV